MESDIFGVGDGIELMELLRVLLPSREEELPESIFLNTEGRPFPMPVLVDFDGLKSLEPVDWASDDVAAGVKRCEEFAVGALRAGVEVDAIGEPGDLGEGGLRLGDNPPDGECRGVAVALVGVLGDGGKREEVGEPPEDCEPCRNRGRRDGG
jgi:hypothetical protein